MRLHDVVIHEADGVRIDGVLRRLLGDSTSAAAVLIDRSGQPLAETGTARTLDIGSIGALAAAGELTLTGRAQRAAARAATLLEAR